MRHNQGCLTFADGVMFNGKFEQGRPLAGQDRDMCSHHLRDCIAGGICEWPDGTKTKLVIPFEFQRFFAPQSNPLGWEVCDVALAVNMTVIYV